MSNYPPGVNHMNDYISGPSEEYEEVKKCYFCSHEELVTILVFSYYESWDCQKCGKENVDEWECND